MASRKGTLPRASSPDGVLKRQERRIKSFNPAIPKGSHGTTKGHKPGSRNPRKIGR